MDANFRTTGPTPLPPKVLLAIGKQMMSHRSEQFSEIMFNVIKYLQPIFGTKTSPLIFTASGTGGLECAIVNILPPKTKALSLEIGVFGRRFSEIAKAYNIELKKLKVEDGKAIDPQDLKKFLRSNKNIGAVFITHNETSTGILNPLKELIEVIRSESDAFVLVDAVSSAGATELEMDNWGIDVIISASQKALMSPPGITILFVSNKAMKASEMNNESIINFV